MNNSNTLTNWNKGINWPLMVLKRPIRTWRWALKYWYPQRLTLRLPDRPRVHAWLWWNF